MTRNEIEVALRQALASVAPETESSTLRPDAPLRDQVDLDSFDFLNFIVALHGRLGIDVREADYPKLATLNGAVDYLADRLASPRP